MQTSSRFRALPPAGVPFTPRDVVASVGAIVGRSDTCREFSRALCRLLDRRHCFLLGSGRAALAVLFKALHSLSPERNEIVLPGYTCFSVPAAAVRAGLRVSVCDVDPETLGIRVDSLLGALTPRTLCVVVTHLYGIPCNVDEVARVAAERGVFLVDDAAQAMGGELNGRLLGTFGDAGVLSLGRGKSLTAVRGGVVVADSDRIAGAIQDQMPTRPDRAGALRAPLEAALISALQRPRLYWLPRRLPFLRLGESVYSPTFSLHPLSRPHAAVGLRMLQRLPSLNEQRVHKAGLLQEKLRVCSPQLRFPRVSGGARAVYPRLPVHSTVPLPDSLEALGVVRSYPAPLAGIPGLSSHLVNPEAELPGAVSLAETTWTLPTHPLVSASDVCEIVRALADVTAESHGVRRCAPIAR